MRQISDKDGIGCRIVLLYLVDSACREGRWAHVPMSMRHAMLFGGENDETYEGLLDVICYE